jgi:hypothetical protein
MKKIVLLPLDERPCNFDFPYKLFNSNDIKIIRPDKLGDKKQAASFGEIKQFLLDACENAEGLVISIDALLYGGLVPSRLHLSSKEEIQIRLELIKALKENNNKLKIYAFQCIMRCPKYSSNDEEPDYYEECGSELQRIGELEHKQKLGIGDSEELRHLYKLVKDEYLTDYRRRRELNLIFNSITLDYVKEGFIDFLIIPQDDSAKYGFTAMDQEIVRKKIREQQLQDVVLMYPGADEIAMTLLARVTNEINGRKPKVFVNYASIHAPFLIPAYEDRSLGETIKYHILAAGCRVTSSTAEADLILAISAPGGEMLEAAMQPVINHNYGVERNITEFVFFVEEQINDGKPVTIGDNAFANGSDLELVELLNKKDLLLKVAGYAGWNTSSNTIGTAISEGIMYLYRGDCKDHRSFLIERYIEDAGYCSQVRKFVTQNKLETLGFNYFDVKEKNGVVSQMICELLGDFVDTRLSSIAENIHINSVDMPWKRMFEIGLNATYKDSKD